MASTGTACVGAGDASGVNEGKRPTAAPTFDEKSSRASLPPAFRAFLQANNVDEAIYDIAPATLPRFIRWVCHANTLVH